MTRVKICGITNYDDAAMAADLGADALGFIFAPSPRMVSPDRAREIITKLPAFVKSVGVFVNEDNDRITDIIDYCGIDIVQLHGDESPEICESFMPRAVKALKIRGDNTPEEYTEYKGKVKAFLLDTYSEKAAGGTGKTFNWDIAIRIKNLGVPVILAGGLDASNIREAVQKVRPYAVDVSSRIEERPGKKDHGKMKELFERLES